MMLVLPTACRIAIADATKWTLTGGRLTIPAIYARLLWLLLRYDSPARRRQRWLNNINQTGTSIKKR